MKLEIKTDDEIWNVFEKSERIPEEEFDALYDVVASFLRTQGSFSESGLEEADFSGNRWIDPKATLSLVSNIPISQSLAEGLRDVLQKLPRPHAVAFDGIDGTSCVTSDGRFWRSQQFGHSE